jgi:hypothetical protein
VQPLGLRSKSERAGAKGDVVPSMWRACGGPGQARARARRGERKRHTLRSSASASGDWRCRCISAGGGSRQKEIAAAAPKQAGGEEYGARGRAREPGMKVEAAQ